MSQEVMAAVFNEWVKRYADNPNEFGDILNSDGRPFTDYGEQAAAYFAKLSLEMKVV